MTARKVAAGLWTGLSTDAKPGFPRVRTGAQFLETDTGDTYVWLRTWQRRSISRVVLASSDVTSTPYTVTASDELLLVDDDAVGGAVAVNLPAAATLGDRFNVIIMKIGSTGAVTIDADGSETINGDPDFDLLLQYESVRLATNGSNWFIIEA